MAERCRGHGILVVVAAVAAICAACSGGGNAGDAGSMPGTGGQAGGGGAAGASACMTTSGAGGSTTDPTLGCAGWRVASSAGTTATAEIAGGSLLFRRPWAPPASPGQANLFNGLDVALRQSSLCGDFDVTIVWHDFQSGGAVGPRLQAGIWWVPPGGGLVEQATAEVTGAGVGQVTIVHDSSGAGDFVAHMPIDGSSGSFRIARAAGRVSVTVTVGDATVTVPSASAFPDQPYTLFLGIGHGAVSNAADNKTGVASVVVDGVTVAGGGGAVVSDDFSCAN